MLPCVCFRVAQTTPMYTDELNCCVCLDYSTDHSFSCSFWASLSPKTNNIETVAFKHSSERKSPVSLTLH